LDSTKVGRGIYTECEAKICCKKVNFGFQQNKNHFTVKGAATSNMSLGKIRFSDLSCQSSPRKVYSRSKLNHVLRLFECLLKFHTANI